MVTNTMDNRDVARDSDPETLADATPEPTEWTCGSCRELEKGAATAEALPDNIVEYDGPDDPECPRNWKPWRKFLFTGVITLILTLVSFGSSILAPAEGVTAEEFGVSATVMNLTVALWIAGIFVGPLIFAPLSEMYGHLLPIALGLSGLSLFQIPIAAAQNVQTVLVCRFISGAFGSAVFSVVSGTCVELYEPVIRGIALSFQAIAITIGATVAPIAGVYLTEDRGWRWTAWVTLIIGGALAFVSLFTLRETSSRIILERKARRLRAETGNWALHAKSEETVIQFDIMVNKYLTKPIRMFLTEPILVIFTTYLTLSYGILYLSFQSFPRAYTLRGWDAKHASLPFIPVSLGILSACGACSVFGVTWYKKRLLHNNGVPLPEDRLPPVIAGSLITPPALLWFGWSMSRHWISQVIASYFIGLGLMLIFVPGIVYIVDVYTVHSNSAMSIHVVVRSLVAASFPMFAGPMYDKLGVEWATSLLAFLCVAMIPAPILFLIYGSKIRSWSRFSYA
ncbi:putative MFS multidrug transporter [Thozetella sp. PMI_491]|nr:putative MFS multidrug transporter [Thozetella sp. PMI_491]